MAAYLAAHSDQVKHALLFLAGLCSVCFVLLLILWDGKPRKEPVSPTVPADITTNESPE
ncbi:hypothetical protein [Frateuria terrea]|uniref:Uncharacterized protein n=1 Tax=Frateuria terrea TaxID=529704 RepID=A0A1H7A1R3_9GAMM|nr:hypothetical protein [Frateuria terrea]SEJ55770.1 hypothetical protein SAMN04487997_0210 [Frateuria terrea]SFP46967.1 hypothetical protein SAMN02927913_2179 [Frateuria terrea]